MLPRRLLKLLLGLLIGFWLGLLLGCVSSLLMWLLLPEQWLANGLADRRARHEALMKGRECKVCSLFASAGTQRKRTVAEKDTERRLLRTLGR